MAARHSLIIMAVAALALTAAGCREAPTDPAGSQVLQSPELQAATSEWLIESFAFSLPNWYLDCLDETVVWSGVVTFADHLVTNGQVNHLNGKASLDPGSTLVGPSGTWVDPKVRNSYRGNGDDYYLNERITWTNQGTGEVMDVDTKIRMVVACNGDLKVSVIEPASCTIR